MFIGKPITFLPHAPEQRLDFIPISNDIRDTLYDLSVSTDNTIRIKDAGGFTNANSPFVIGHASFSNYTHAITTRHQSNLVHLGYSSNWTRIISHGGTSFTNYLFRFRYIVTNMHLSDAIYEAVFFNETFRIYKSHRIAPFGVRTTSDVIGDFSERPWIMPFDAQNELYRTITDNNNDIVKLLTPASIYTDGSRRIFTFELEQAGNLYVFTHRPTSFITKYGEGAINVPFVNSIQSTSYPNTYNANPRLK